MNLICTRCKQRPAVFFFNRSESGQNITDGLCVRCAREAGVPQLSEMLDKLGISEDDMDTISEQISEMFSGEKGFEPGGAMAAFPTFLMGNMPPSPKPQEENTTPPAIRPEKPAESEEKARRDGAKPKQRPKRKFLDSYCENLTDKAVEGKLDRIVGRDREIYRVMQILNRRQKNNPCLIGEPGVGKTAIAEGLAQRMASGNVPPRLANRELYMLDLTALVAGTQFRGQFESRMKGLVDDISEAKNVILFIDEVHNLIGAGNAEGSMNAANILKPALSRGAIQVIGATTFDEYRRHIEKDAALERRFQPVTVDEPSIADTIEVLMGIKGYYEQYHRVRVGEETIRQTVMMSERYITDRYLPDKAIDLLDEACSGSTLENKELARYEELIKKRDENLFIISELESHSEEQNFEALAEIKSEIARLEQGIAELKQTALDREVTVEDLARVIELWTGIPATKVREGEAGRVLGLADALKKRVIGQEQAVDLVAAAIRRTRIQLSTKRRPASFVFVGPTGVGKTELVRCLANELFSTADPLIRLDMSEFMEKHAVSRIVGSPPGYVGYDEAGQLTEKVRRKPYSVVLFDEIEKAHPDVLNILLQILDEGRLTDAHGRVVSFENTVIVMTSNAGSQHKGGALGFDKTPGEQAKERTMRSLTDFLRPEFLGRVDEVVVFRSLNEEDYAKIAALMLEEYKEPLAEREIRFGYSQEACALIANKAFGKKAGARDVRDVIRREVEDAMTSLLLEHSESPPALLSVSVLNNELKFEMA